MKPIILLAALFAFIVSCSDNPTPERTNGYTPEMKTKEDSLFQEVMEGHDAAMAKMGKLSGLRKQANQKADSLAKMKSATSEERVRSLRHLANDLQSSESNMNAWMEAFSIDSAKDDKSKRIAYLESEKAKVTNVKNQVLRSVSLADSLLKR